MNDIDRYLDQACRSVRGPVALRKHLRKELTEHLEDAISELVATGLSRDEAAKKVIEDFGEPEIIREGLQSVYGQSVTSLFVDKAMEWKERTMKTAWKWNFAAHLGLVVIIALTAFFIASAFVFVVPVVVESYVDLGISAPDYLIALINIAYLIQQTAWIWVIALAGGLILFEWKCRSENKALIRTAIGVGASLVSLAIAFWVAAAIVIPLVQVRHATIDQQQEFMVMAKIIEAHESYKQLAQAIKDENWPAADDSVTEVRDAYRFLRDMPTTIVVLAGENQLGNPREIRRLMKEIADFSDNLHDSIRDNRAPSITLEYFSQLKKSYAQLETESTFFTNHLEPEAHQEVTEEGTSETGSIHEPEPRNMPK